MCSTGDGVPRMCGASPARRETDTDKPLGRTWAHPEKNGWIPGSYATPGPSGSHPRTPRPAHLACWTRRRASRTGGMPVHGGGARVGAIDTKTPVVKEHLAERAARSTGAKTHVPGRGHDLAAGVLGLGFLAGSEELRPDAGSRFCAPPALAVRAWEPRRITELGRVAGCHRREGMDTYSCRTASRRRRAGRVLRARLWCGSETLGQPLFSASEICFDLAKRRAEYHEFFEMQLPLGCSVGCQVDSQTGSQGVQSGQQGTDLHPVRPALRSGRGAKTVVQARRTWRTSSGRRLPEGP